MNSIRAKNHNHPMAVSTDKRLHYLLNEIADSVDAGFACICLRDGETHSIEIVDIYSRNAIPETMWRWLLPWLDSILINLKPNSRAQTLDMNVEESPYTSVLIAPLMLASEKQGGVFMFSSVNNHMAHQDSDNLTMLVELVQTVIENDYLVEKLIINEAVTTTAQAIARSPIPQNIVQVLRDYLFESHINLCVIALYMSDDANAPGARFDYVEIKGDWSAQRGSQTLSGLRIPLDEFPDLSDNLNEDRFMFVNAADVKNEPLDRFSELLISSGGVSSLVLVPLESRQRRLGVLAIGSDAPHKFSWQELRTYQVISEFLTISTMTETLQREHDFIQQGRAALLDAVTDGVVMTLPNTHANILTTNDQFHRMFNLSSDTVQGKSLWTLLGDMRLPNQVRKDLKQTWQSHDPLDTITLNGEFSMPDERSHQRDIQWYSAPVFRNREVMGRIYTFHNITAERVSERLRFDLLSRVSHELRTPLTSIRGFAEFILEMTHDELPDLAREYTEIILNSAKHLNHVFNDLIEFTRANVGEIELYIIDAAVQDTIIDVVARLEMQHKARDQRIIMLINDEYPLIPFDTERVGQVLTNLLNNAIQYAPRDTTIYIGMAEIHTLADLPEGAPADTVLPCMLVSIIDEGAGLTEDESEVIFLPFYRTKAATAAQVPGSGLGLAVSRGIIELHRGRLWAQAATTDAPGGRFYFTLPTTPAT